VLNGLIGGHRANEARDGRDKRVRIAAGVDKQATAKDQTSRKGVVDSHCWLRNDVIIVNIGRDTDDAVRRHQACLVGIRSGEELQYGIRPKNMPVDGILIGEHALCESLADDPALHLTAIFRALQGFISDEGEFRLAVSEILKEGHVVRTVDGLMFYS